MQHINKNLTVFHGSHYKGMPVYTTLGGLILEYVDHCFDQVMEMGNYCSKALLVRFDAKYPKYFDPEHIDKSNKVVDVFTKRLERLLDRREERKKKQGVRVSPHRMRYVWVREQENSNDHWHYHFAIMVNKHAFRSVGITKNIDTLAGMIGSAWCHAIKIDEMYAGGVIYIPPRAGYVIDYSLGIPAEAFYRISYLCKARTKRYGLGSHVIGSSRIVR